MNTEFHFFPEEASAFAPRVDHLFLFLLGVATFFTLLILTLIVYFAIKYRRGARIDRALSVAGRTWVLEATWAAIPLALMMAMFGWGATLYFDEHRPPPDAMEVNVVAKQWMWKLQQPGGRREINELHVPVGKAIRLRLISEDVIHSFFVPSFRVKQDVLPGRYTSLWFTPTRVGRYHLFCAQYCGTSHAQMAGEVVVMQPAEYAAWLSGLSNEPPAVAGQRLFLQFRCNNCHTPTAAGAPRCPSLLGLAGSMVKLSDGRQVLADDDYLRESIVDPKAKIVAGYEPLMPTFRGQIGEEGILDLIAYLKSLTAKAPAPPDRSKSIPKP